MKVDGGDGGDGEVEKEVEKEVETKEIWRLKMETKYTVGRLYGEGPLLGIQYDPESLRRKEKCRGVSGVCDFCDFCVCFATLFVLFVVVSC